MFKMFKNYKRVSLLGAALLAVGGNVLLGNHSEAGKEEEVFIEVEHPAVGAPEQKEQKIKDKEKKEEVETTISISKGNAQPEETAEITARETKEAVRVEEAPKQNSTRIETEGAHLEEVDLESQPIVAEEAQLEAERIAAAEEAQLEAERIAAEEAERIAAAEEARLEAERVAAEEAARLEAERIAAEEAANRLKPNSVYSNGTLISGYATSGNVYIGVDASYLSGSLILTDELGNPRTVYIAGSEPIYTEDGSNLNLLNQQNATQLVNGSFGVVFLVQGQYSGIPVTYVYSTY